MFERLIRLTGVVATVGVAACTTPEVLIAEPELPPVTQTRNALLDLPPPARRLEVAVYRFEDLTGQFKPSENFQTLSKAVSQGGGPMLVKALRDAGNRQWFRVVERTNLSNLLQERKIIQEMRQRYLGETRVNPNALPPMVFAGVIIEGAIVGFDSNTVTGGAGARLLGIGGGVEYRHNTMSVNLRAVSVKTGEVLATVLVQKSIISAGISANVFKFIDFDELLEVEAGITTNEPGFVALTRTIEKAVFGLIMEMVAGGYWSFQNEALGESLLNRYLVEEGRVSQTQLAAHQAASAALARAGDVPQQQNSSATSRSLPSADLEVLRPVGAVANGSRPSSGPSDEAPTQLPPATGQAAPRATAVRATEAVTDTTFATAPDTRAPARRATPETAHQTRERPTAAPARKAPSSALGTPVRTERLAAAQPAADLGAKGGRARTQSVPSAETVDRARDATTVADRNPRIAALPSSVERPRVADRSPRAVAISDPRPATAVGGRAQPVGSASTLRADVPARTAPAAQPAARRTVGDAAAFRNNAARSEGDAETKFAPAPG